MSTLQTVGAKLQAALDEVDAALAQAALPPSISGFSVAPLSLPVGGGTVVVSATVTGPLPIALQVNGANVPQLPVPVPVTASETVTLVASNANGSVQQSADVVVAVAPPPPGGPAWWNGQPLMTLIGIPGTQFSGFALDDCIAAGLCDSTGWTTAATGSTQGQIRKGMFAYSGGSLDLSNGELLLFGGGGANASPANHVVGLPLLADAPRWRTRIAPSNVSQVYPKGSTPSHARNRDLTPAPRHSYNQAHPVGQDFVVIGCQSCWDTDGTPDNPLACAIGTLGQPWDPARQIPDMPGAYSKGYDGACAAQDPRDGTIYQFGNQSIGKRAPNGTWTTFASPPYSGVDRAIAVVDTKRNLLIRIGLIGANNQAPTAFDLSTGVATNYSLVGPDVAALNLQYWSAGIVYDEFLDAIVVFRDDGFLYRLDYVGTNQLSVSKMPIAGTVPTGNNPGGMPNGGCWGRMQFVRQLKGIVLVRSDAETAWFVRTT